MNSSYNVSSSTLRVMTEEFQRGFDICEAMETNIAEWDTLFAPYPFFEAYKHYPEIDIITENEDDLRKWKGWVESRLPTLTFKAIFDFLMEMGAAEAKREVGGTLYGLKNNFHSCRNSERDCIYMQKT
ncbi:nuclear poly(A) polymerase 1-like [Ananas comosus]|uniref:polynucleotide adenylyltransferase n=1 Tax=Ananas comosus TaxID=4615 RepID=A0A6P5FXU3_ANACO|nr:nuclear poly(A) polymerase 1-like [Ananas comosus]